ncbi:MULTISPECIES: OsmC family protein [unclassified Duganella]|uniref:OsmC family protein n=1 Tax=unclassified Duganella TaxID=2636909 RepID=UPI00088E5270|nr:MULTISPECIES: OsmC family protein [unclassified Duganella]SDH34944.1 Organic hydroperoxide reductase OsmC/OhrA [Duganella sp. OV458]SDK51468.1 Organic hydroperoxide reductase OsmC/OhrA [Duganella sp. OV510]
MKHHYQLNVTWTGNRGSGTSSYRDYGRDHIISAPGKPAIPGSSDPAFRGDATRWNPEELLLASAAACHKLWYLHLCADANIIVTAYEDEAEGTMLDERFERIILRPHVTIASGDRELALRLHHTAHEKCYIANSVNFPILCEPLIM